MPVLGRKVWTGEVLSVPDLQGFLQDQVVMVFANVAARTAAVAAPAEGMTCKLLDSGRVEDYSGGAWRARSGLQTVGYANGSLAAVNNVNLGSLVVNPGRPYRLHAWASAITTVGTGATGSLRLLFSVPAATIQDQFLLTPAVQTGKVHRSIDVTDGTARTVFSNLEVTAGTIQYYNDARASFLETRWEAL